MMDEEFARFLKWCSQFREFPYGAVLYWINAFREFEADLGKTAADASVAKRTAEDPEAWVWQ